MERQKRKLKGIADLYNIEDERQRRQPSSEDVVSQQDTSHQNISGQSTFQPPATLHNIPRENTSPKNISKSPENSPVASSDIKIEPSSVISSQDVSNQDIPQQNTSLENISTANTWAPDFVDAGRGYFPIYNDITDRLIRELQLDVYEQSILLKMYRESRGWKSDECEISHAEIVRACNISKSQSQRTLAKLTSKGLIVNLGRSKSGPERNRFKVLPGVPVIPPRNIFSEDISHEGTDISPENTVFGQDISHLNTNKNNNKELLNTHTQTGVGVGSAFSLEECRRFAEHLQKTGQGITNPGGYATTIFRSGEADAQIETFLKSLAIPKLANAKDCPICQGAGYWYPEGPSKGVVKCKHERLMDSSS
jgi:hypothetical protein